MKPVSNSDNQVVFTLSAKCRDCYRCLKVCPVKAIKMVDNQAYVVEERCIACGTCIRECPQGAKTYRSDLLKVKKYKQDEEPIAISLAPSYAALYDTTEKKLLFQALHNLGFSYIGETAVGAYPVALATRQFVEQAPPSPLICTACPAVINYIEKYEPELVERLVPVSSPMVTHARMLKDRYQSAVKTVFVGPCVAKKTEGDRPKNQTAVDAVLTFAELNEWLSQIRSEQEEEPGEGKEEELKFHEYPSGNSRLFPLPGGLLKTAAMTADSLDLSVLTIHGIEALKEVIKGIKDQVLGPCLIEPLFCLEGCINGPGIKSPYNLYERKRRLIHYHNLAVKEATPHNEQSPTPVIAPLADTRFTAMTYVKPQKSLTNLVISEELIAVTLSRTGKSNPENQLNCGSCGYPSCREKAIAVLSGMAEEQMCLPYMRRLAEQRTDKIIETSPGGIVIVNEQLKIIKMNPAFMTLFHCDEGQLNTHIAEIIDPDPFEQIKSGQKALIELSSHHHTPNELICHEIYYQIEAEQQYVGIFFNITDYQRELKQYENLKKETIIQARELLNHQIEMAQKIAQFLGMNTARSEDLVRKLMKLAEKD